MGKISYDKLERWFFLCVVGRGFYFPARFFLYLSKCFDWNWYSLFFTGGVVVFVIKKEYHIIPEYSDSLEPLIKQYQNEGLWVCIERSVVHKYFCEKTGVSFRSRFLHWPLYSYILVDYFFKCFIPKGYFLSSFVEIRLCVMDEYHIVDVDFIMHED